MRDPQEFSLDNRFVRWAVVRRPADQCLGNRFSSVRDRLGRREHALRFGPANDGPCIRHAKVGSVPVQSESAQGFLRQDRHARAVVQVDRHAGQDSATFRVA